jgi:MFS family permease
VRLLVAGVLLDSLAFFASLPFLALYLSRSALGAATIGAIVGSIPLVAAFGGLLGGVLADRFGGVTLMRAGLAGYVSAYLLLAMIRSLPLIIALIGLLGVSRALVEPSLKKLLSLAAPETGGTVFRLRYIAICLGAICGPLIGAVLYGVAIWLFFALPAVLYAGFAAALQASRAGLHGYDAPAWPSAPPGGGPSPTPACCSLSAQGS